MTDPLDIVATLPPMHPGELLREEFLVPLDLDATGVARALDVEPTLIARIAAEEVGITGDTAIRLARLFGTTPQFWMNAQAHYELEVAKAAIGARIDRIVPIRTAA